MGKDAVQEREPALRRQRSGGGADDLGADREVAEHPALVGDPELCPVGELSRLAGVVEDRRRHQQVGVEPRMQHAGLEHQGRDRNRVLDHPPR